MWTQVEAAKVRRGNIVMLNGSVRLVTKREKWNATHVKVHYEDPSHPGKRVRADCAYLRLTDLIDIHQGS